MAVRMLRGLFGLLQGSQNRVSKEREALTKLLDQEIEEIQTLSCTSKSRKTLQDSMQFAVTNPPAETSNAGI